MAILTEKFNTVHDTAPFSQISEKDYISAFDEGIALTKKEIEDIVNNPEPPTFENTIEALAYSGLTLDRISNIFFNLHSAETNDELEKIAQDVAPKLSALGNDITLNTDLFSRVKAVYEQKDSLTLTTEQQTLLEKSFKDFARNGALLNNEQKQKLRDIDAKLSVLKLKFGENVLADSNAYQLHITKEEGLAGLPEGVIEAAASLAKSKNKDGWIFTLDYPSYIPFVTYADNRELRKEISLAAGRKGFQENENNNETIVLEIVQLRHQRAQLLGYETHADFVLAERMAESPSKVLAFLNDLLAKAKPAAEKEFQELTAFAKEKDGIEVLEKWDGSYYSEKLKQQKFQLDDELLKPYFKLENVLKGAFEVAHKLYNLTFSKVHNIDKYHPDVQTYEVKDEQDNLVAIFYADFFPRKGKRQGAWMTSFKPQYIKDGINERPHISIVCNFTPPTETKPALLTFNEVTTLFHEFGHALHGMLANTTYPNLSGTSVFWDFVELPSQIMENWCYEKEALTLFAKHYETGELIPMELVEKIKESASFLEGMATVRQLSFGLLDMGWHGQDPSAISKVKDFEKLQFASTQLFPDVEDNAMSTSFSHIFNGGYSSGYYSYKWAEVLDADAFEYFKENGIFNKEVANKFKENILSKGGTTHPMKLYKAFRGQEPAVDALLRRAGLIK
ncbi:M3 family metallopeptidase [Sphingobacterium litopenaei]|uniref:M3 family metallopeptidase n=1 Tax=Sphingobacterium litopenaei TaxID=2763500 RepID=A0ABR7YGZ8_9SPHI|nr:M3 family metallopeptidase [Sphingobacterium litopenaei]MBD1430551.1 M3 family metallopeptidase [Sphingobacterium litopenaei]